MISRLEDLYHEAEYFDEREDRYVEEQMRQAERAWWLQEADAIGETM